MGKIKVMFQTTNQYTIDHYMYSSKRGFEIFELQQPLLHSAGLLPASCSTAGPIWHLGDEAVTFIGPLSRYIKIIKEKKESAEPVRTLKIDTVGVYACVYIYK